MHGFRETKLDQRAIQIKYNLVKVAYTGTYNNLDPGSPSCWLAREKEKNVGFFLNCLCLCLEN